MSYLDIKNISLDSDGANAVLSAKVGDFDLYYKAPSYAGLTLSPETFVVAALFPAMARGETLRLAPGHAISSTLLENLNAIQRIYSSWSERLHPVRIECEVCPPRLADETRVGSFFSGGVDSMYTMLTRSEEVTHLVLLGGLDFAMKGEELETSSRRNQEFAASFGKTFIPVETNYKSFGRHHKIARILSHGSALAAVGLALRYRRFYIPSSHHYTVLEGWGTHPLTDPLWSDGGVNFTHDWADVLRVEKTRVVATNPRALEALRVCWTDPNKNCGTCSKCVRTMFTLDMLGAGPGPFPPFKVSQLNCLVVNNGPQLMIATDMLSEANKRGCADAARILRRKVRGYYWLNGRTYFDRVFLGGMLGKLYRAIHPVEPYDHIEFNESWPKLY